jgi:hypothetical protein
MFFIDGKEEALLTEPGIFRYKAFRKAGDRFIACDVQFNLPRSDRIGCCTKK